MRKIRGKGGDKCKHPKTTTFGMFNSLWKSFSGDESTSAREATGAGGAGGGVGAAAGLGAAPARPVVNLLVIDGDASHDWSAVFRGCTVDVKCASTPGDGVGSTESETAGATPSSSGASSITAPAASIGAADAHTGAASAASDEVHSTRHETESRTPGDSTVTCDICVEQVGWNEFNLTAYAGEGVLVDIYPTGSKHGRVGTFKPDMLLVRNVVRGVRPDQDARNLLYGFRYAGIPCVNSIESILMTQERPLCHAALLDIERRLGADAFPLLPQTYYPNHQAMMFTPQYPIVAKVGHAHAGFGKMRLTDHHAFNDLKSVVALTPCYCTAEEFVEGAYDLRIQKIGDHYRAYKRIAMSGEWKTNTGTSVMEEIELTEEYKRWVDEASASFGGMDICTVDAIHSAEDGKEWILEMNGTSSGLAPEREEEDTLHIRDVVLKRMAEKVTHVGQ